MAYLKNMDEEEEGATPVATTQASGVMGQGVGTQGGQPSLNQGWVNFDKYLKANEGQGEGIANAVTAGADDAIKSAAGKLNELEQKASNVDKSQTQALSTTKNVVMSDPTKVDVQSYQKQMSEGYKGPTQVSALDSWADAYKAWGSANDQYKAVSDNSAAGRQAAVTNAFKPTAMNGYTRGMGTLDSFILGGDAKGKETLNAFTEANKGIANQWNTTSSRAQASLDGAKRAYEDERKAVQSAADAQYAAYLKKAQDTKGAGYEKAWQDANAEIDAKFSGAGVKAPMNYNEWLKQNDAYSWTDSVDDATLAALNNLAQLDSSADTGLVNRGSNKALSVDWGAIDAYLASQKPKGPTTTTENVSALESGTGSEGQRVTTTYPDGSYDVMGPAGEIIKYNADGTIKGTAGTNIFT